MHKIVDNPRPALIISVFQNGGKGGKAGKKNKKTNPLYIVPEKRQYYLAAWQYIYENKLTLLKDNSRVCSVQIFTVDSSHARGFILCCIAA
ncbi:MAG: hypothetical protein J6S92_07925 [Oscillospiraceae bacterium]|nr:hypothetical protein [Oscillospiraceae bacterium]MBP0988193.1 hypothetical protein [Oscillospiraceae bacterium]